MRRVIVPLTKMGATIGSSDGRPPLVIDGGPLRGITHRPDVPSAQVKSCVLLAGLNAEGLTTVEEPTPTRDHTERALETFGLPVTRGSGARDRRRRRITDRTRPHRARRHLRRRLLGSSGSRDARRRRDDRRRRAEPDPHRSPRDPQTRRCPGHRADRRPAGRGTGRDAARPVRRLAQLHDRTGRRARRDRRDPGPGGARRDDAARPHRSRFEAHGNCGSRKAIASARWRPASRRWAARSRNTRTVSG